MTQLTWQQKTVVELDISDMSDMGECKESALSGLERINIEHFF